MYGRDLSTDSFRKPKENEMLKSETHRQKTPEHCFMFNAELISHLIPKAPNDKIYICKISENHLARLHVCHILDKKNREQTV